MEVRVTVNRKPYYINTGVRVLCSEWKYDSVIDRPDSAELNERLIIILRRVEQEINACLAQSRAIDVAEVRRRVNDVGSAMEGADTFLDWVDEQIDMLTVSEGTRKHYRTLSVRLRQFGTIRTWENVTTENIVNLDAWLHTVENGNRKASRLSYAGIYTYHKCLKSLLNRAFAVGKIPRNPYDKLRGKIKRGEKENVEYLTEEEMHAIRSMDFKRGTLLCRARDLFIVQMYTGMAYSDVMAFDIDSYKLVDGKWVNRQERIKTGVAYINQLLPPVVEVLERYGMRVPWIDQADYNHALKAIGEAAGIKTRMHSHLARHTFATFMLRNGVKIENLQKMLGHNSIVTTQRYAKVLAQAVHDDFSMIAEKIQREAR